MPHGHQPPGQTPLQQMGRTEEPTTSWEPQGTSEQPEQPLNKLKCKVTVKDEEPQLQRLWRENRREQRAVLAAPVLTRHPACPPGLGWFFLMSALAIGALKGRKADLAKGCGICSIL